MKHLRSNKIKNLSVGKKSSIGMWGNRGDSSTYVASKINLDILSPFLEKYNEDNNTRVNSFHFIIFAGAKALGKYPELNRYIRFNQAYQRDDESVFFHIIERSSGDLLGHRIQKASKCTLSEIFHSVKQANTNVQNNQSIYQESRRFSHLIPSFLMRPVLELLGFCLYSLNLNFKFLKAPKDPFGSLMVSNIGALGCNQAFIPLARYARTHLSVAVGKPRKEAIVDADDKIKVGLVVDAWWTFDHRLLDGLEISRIINYIQLIADNPQDYI